jgi:hypothetical protein
VVYFSSVDGEGFQSENCTTIKWVLTSNNIKYLQSNHYIVCLSFSWKPHKRKPQNGTNKRQWNACFSCSYIAHVCP